MRFWWALIPLISALTSWFPGWLAVKLMLHPGAKIMGFRLPGIFQQRKKQLITDLAKLVSHELGGFTELDQKIHPHSLKKMMPEIEGHIDHFLKVKLKATMPVVGMLVGEKTIGSLKEVFMNELESLFPVIMKSYLEEIKNDLNIQQIVSEKLESFPVEKFQSVFYRSLSKELRMFHLFCFLMGFIIGLVQVILIFSYK